MSKFGLISAGAYIAFAIVCALGSAFMADAKGSFVLKQLPVALQSALVDALGLGDFFESVGWLSTYLLIGGGTAVVLYAFGALVEKVVR